ncbi:hypothetical protein LPU83_pLPU83d_1352 (plasmid) [Rhizobium favelukesii]|uniref:Uncharacterized protein n=1 Tax=Rhizobium favelukesii TaxID=348824 RepID=W6RNP8_9HYPH|nr:hypothetical protein LPU83_pLPU83d_1352 [Rhizobium favelukesii]
MIQVALAKGHVENTNRRAREWLSREDPLSITDRDLKEISDQFNATPRKCLGYRTPAEILRQKLNEDELREGPERMLPVGVGHLDAGYAERLRARQA